MPETPEQVPQDWQMVLIASSAPRTACGLAANGPAFSAFRKRRIDALNRSRHLFRTLGVVRCPRITNASASIPGSCGTTISLPPVGLSPLVMEANHANCVVGKPENVAGQGSPQRYRSQSRHIAQPERISETACVRKVSTSSAVAAIPMPRISALSSPRSSTINSRARRALQRRTAPRDRFRARKRMAWVKACDFKAVAWSDSGRMECASHIPSRSAATQGVCRTLAIAEAVI